MPIPLSLVEVEVEGAETLSNLRIGADGLEGRFVRVHAKRELGAQWRVVPDVDVHAALIFGFKCADFWKKNVEDVRYQLSLRARAAFLSHTTLEDRFRSLDAYLETWVEEMGIESAADLLILEPTDLLPVALQPHELEDVLKRLPDEVVIGSKRAKVTYELKARIAILHINKRWVKTAINPRFLPAVEGFSVVVRDGTRQRMLRK